MPKYKFSIFTPCYNSSRFIYRVFKTLNSQTFRNFEWIVINDCSTDDTCDLIKNYVKGADFLVKFYNNSVNQMLAANYNKAIGVAEGEFFFPMAHDDEFVSNVLEEYNRLLIKYDSARIAGIVSRCKTQYGAVTTELFDRPVMNYWEYAYIKGKYIGEMPYCYKTDILRRYLPYDLTISKSTDSKNIDGLIGCDYDCICSNMISRTYYIDENETSMSIFNKKNNNKKGKFNNQLLEINLFQYKRVETLKGKMRTVALCVFYGMICNYSFSYIIRQVNKKIDKMLCAIFFPFVYFLVKLDSLRQVHQLFVKIIE